MRDTYLMVHKIIALEIGSGTKTFPTTHPSTQQALVPWYVCTESVYIYLTLLNVLPSKAGLLSRICKYESK